MAGPGIQHLGMTSAVWSDHTDIPPTIMSLLDLQGQLPAGRAGPERVPVTAMATRRASDLTELGSIYKQINAPFATSLRRARSLDAGAFQRELDRRRRLHGDLGPGCSADLGPDALAGQMRDVLNEAEFGGQQPTQQQVDDLTFQG